MIHLPCINQVHNIDIYIYITNRMLFNICYLFYSKFASKFCFHNR